MARFDRAIATAERLIKRNGQQVTWRSTQRAEVPGKPWQQGEATDVDRTVSICFLPINQQMKQLWHYLRGTNDVPAGNVQGLMAGNIGFEPKSDDVVLRDGETLRIKTIELLAPNGQRVLYTVEFES